MMEMFLAGKDPTSFCCAQEPSRRRRITYSVAFDAVR